MLEAMKKIGLMVKDNIIGRTGIITKGHFLMDWGMDKGTSRKISQTFNIEENIKMIKNVVMVKLTMKMGLYTLETSKTIIATALDSLLKMER